MRSGGSLEPAGDVPLIVFHGDRDSTVAPVNAERIIASRVGVTRTGRGVGAAPKESTTHGADGAAHPYSRSVYRDADGSVAAELWIVHGGAHAWSGGSPVGSFTDPHGLHACAEMVRFFFQHPSPRARCESLPGFLGRVAVPHSVASFTCWDVR